MVITAGQEVMYPEYGPRIYVDGNLRVEHRNVTVDTEIIGNNLQYDFSELSQDDWQHNIVFVTDKLPEYYGGLTVNLLHENNFRSKRFLSSIANQVRYWFDTSGIKNPSIEWLQAKARGHEVLTVLNIAGDHSDWKGDEFYPTGNPPCVSEILAHELHHATGELQDNRISRDSLDDLRKHYNRVAMYAGGTLLTGGIGLSSLIALAETANLRLGAEPIEASAGAMVAGFTAATAIVYKGLHSLSFEKSGLHWPEHLYGHGEDHAQAYALATRDRWLDVVRV